MLMLMSHLLTERCLHDREASSTLVVLIHVVQ